MEFQKLQNILFLALLIIVTIVFAFLLKPFFFPLFWAAVIASLFYPVYKKITAGVKNKNLGSILTVLLVIIIIIIPLVLLGSLIFKETVSLYLSIRDNESSINLTLQNIFQWLKTNTLTNRLNIDQASIAAKINDAAGMLTSYLFTLAKNFTQNSFTFLVMFIITIYSLFFFLRDGDKLLKKLMYISPLGDRHEMILYKKFTSTARAALKGTLIVGAIQGLLGAIMFSLLGIEGAVIWGLIMMFFSIIPGFGSYVVWMPAAIIMFILSNIWQGIVIILFGSLVISTIDNFIRPVLVGKDTQMHPLLILFSTLGGLVVFGLSGFVLGPIVTALLISLWEMYEENYKTGLDNNN